MTKTNPEPHIALNPPHRALTLQHKKPNNFNTLEERISNALRIVADIIANGGEVYLPIFERLENELAQERLRRSTLGRALALSRQ